jgi:hypothetical protein
MTCTKNKKKTLVFFFFQNFIQRNNIYIMSVQYSDVPAGSLMSIPPAIPQGMLYRVKKIMGVSNQTLKMAPLSGQTTATNGQKIIVSLPPT